MTAKQPPEPQSHAFTGPRAQALMRMLFGAGLVLVPVSLWLHSTLLTLWLVAALCCTCHYLGVMYGRKHP